ncbi:MAG: hypothetical protein HC773_19485 [Scytonema sp. CRU_2_7]|nr:hypothetical protein [Scytonema sp. CRU_2_7]
MSLLRCQINARPGWKFGALGTCFVGHDARSKAVMDGRTRDLSKIRHDIDENVLSQIQRRQQNFSTRVSRSKRQPKWLYPLPAERQYSRALVAYIDLLSSKVTQIVVPHLQEILSRRNAEVPEPMRSDDYADDITTLSTLVRLSLTILL